ncbi:MAG: hypothetical protein AAF621_00930 [Pseudomonadota bacterium]
MNGAMVEFLLRTIIFLAFFLAGAYFLFLHVEHVKQKYGSPEDENNYMSIIKHYFFRKFTR